MATQAQVDLLHWVDRFSTASEAFNVKFASLILGFYTGTDFYSPAAVAAAAQQAAQATNTNAIVAAGLAGQYVAVTSSLIAGENLPAPTLFLAPLRNGADMAKVYERPAKMFRRLRSRGVEPAEAFRQAMELARVIAETNMTLAQREAYQQTFQKLEQRVKVTGYRRVVHPELSRTGSCGLCIVASDHHYKTAELLPIHGNCKCTVLPIIGDSDPGSGLNNLTLADFYAAAGGSTHGDDLKKVRVVVNQHGEYGPVLGVKGDHFLGPDGLRAAA